VNVRNLWRAMFIVAVALVPMAIASTASAAGRFSCRASAARVVLLGTTLEPVVANAGSDPCQTQISTRGAPETSGLVTVGAADAATVNEGQGTATARVADVGVNLSTLLPLQITISGLNASSSYKCDALGNLSFEGSSTVAGVKIAGLVINIPDPNAPVDIDLGDILTLHLNQTVVAGTGDLIQVTRRAAFLESKLLGIQLSLAEATAGFAGDACGLGILPTQPTNPTGIIQRIFVPVPGPTAGLTPGIVPGACASKPFTLGVNGVAVKSTVFTIDGKTYAKIGRNNHPKITINPEKIGFGTHKIKAVVSFSAKGVRPKTLNLIFRRCGAEIPTNAQFGKCVQIRITNDRPGKVFVALFSGPKSIRTLGGHLYNFTAPGSRVVCLKVPLRAATFKPGTTRTFTVAVKFPNGKNFIKRVRIA
jgi:hypothetical protein